MRIDDGLTHKGHGSVTRLVDFTDHAPEIELEVRFELAGKLLHPLVVREAVHLQRLDAAIASAQKGPFEQHSTDPVTLPRLLDAERRFALANEHGSEAAQFSSAPQDAVDTKNRSNHPT